MKSKEEINKFIDNLAIQNIDDIFVTFRGVTKKCNQAFWNSESEKDHATKVGSFGRGTAINGTSDLDMLFVLPDELYTQYDEYEGNGQSALLQKVKDVLLEKYPTSDITADGQVIKFNHTKFLIEILPCFSLVDGSFRFANTNNGGSWEITKPIEEIEEINRLNSETGGVLKNLCKMIRAWKNKNGVPIGGFLIDTLCFRFLSDEAGFHKIEMDEYADMCLSFFTYLADQDEEQEYWLAPGSNQRVYKKSNFVPKAKKARNNCEKAIENEEKESARSYWKRIFGRPFPTKEIVEKSEGLVRFDNTEQFIEDNFPISIKDSLRINCKVVQDGFRTMFLRDVPLLKSKYSLEFFVESTSVKKPYDLYWKVLNVGNEAEKRNQIRGQILKDEGRQSRVETSSFKGEHIVDAYIVKNNRVVARDSIPVNIDDINH